MLLLAPYSLDNELAVIRAHEEASTPTLALASFEQSPPVLFESQAIDDCGRLNLVHLHYLMEELLPVTDDFRGDLERKVLVLIVNLRLFVGNARVPFLGEVVVLFPNERPGLVGSLI